MLYYSEKVKNFYKTEAELKAAEKKYQDEEASKKAKREARKARAKEVEDAYKNYQKLLNKFVEDYGSYHMSITDNTPFDLFDFLFRL